MMTETVWLQRSSPDEPWGFRLQGGRDYQTPLSVQKVTSGSIAATGLSSGDVIRRIGETDTSSLTYTQAMEVIKESGNLLQLSVSKQGGHYPQAPQVETDSTSNMASGALHDLFQDLYRYSEPAAYPQEGAQGHNTSHPSYPYTQSSPYTQSGQSAPYAQPAPPSAFQSPSQPQRGYGQPREVKVQHGDRSYQDQSHGAPSHQYTGPTPGAGFPPQAPPTYSDVQTHRDQVSFPYKQSQSQTQSQPSSAPQYHYQGAPAPGQYQYPQSVSSSTSELSDISSGIGTSDGKPCGSSPALGMSQPSLSKPCTSTSSVDSSSGVGSYRCETPEQTDSVCLSKPDLGRQDSFPPPPPPLPQEASFNNHLPTEAHPRTPPLAEVPVSAPPPAPPLPPPAPPLPPPTKSWKIKQSEDEKNQQPPTRLEQQLSNMSINSDYGRQDSFPPPPPSAYQPQSPQPYTPSYQPAEAPQYGGQSPSVSRGTPQYGGYTPSTPTYGGQTPTYTPQSPSSHAPRPIPDAVLNMAAKGEPDKKPWAYAPDMDVIKEQRDKVRRSVNKDQNQDITQSPVYRMIHGLDANKPKARPVAPEALDAQGIGDYDQASIRYTGRNIPSKSFRMLQSMTGPEPNNLQVPGARRVRRKPETVPEQNPDDIVDISYVGGNIPSRSFKVLQHAMGHPDHNDQDDTLGYHEEDREDPDAAYNDMYYMGKGIPSRSFQLLQSAVGEADAHTIASERRRRRRNAFERQRSQQEEADKDDGDFDENAYLAGQVPLNVSAEQRTPRVQEKDSECEVIPWQRPEPASAENNFDEEYYLSGRIPVINDQPKQPIKPLASELMFANSNSDEPDVTNNETFSEDDYLAGRVPILGGESNPRPSTAKANEEEPVWVKKQREKQNTTAVADLERFEALHYLNVQATDSSRRNKEEDSKPEDSNFDEDAYLAGEMSLLGGEPVTREPGRTCTEARAAWQKDADDDTGSAFDEDEYLRGKVPILRESVDRELPPREHKSKPYRERASWERSGDDDTQSRDHGENFDENRYLAGRVPTSVRTSMDRESPSPAVNGTNNQFSTVPSRTFHYLRRSISREGSPSSRSSGRSPSRQSSFDSGDDCDDPNRVISDMMYQGKNIPSKTFLKLKKSISKRPQNKRKPTDPIENMRLKAMDDSLLIDHAMDKLAIDSHDPDQYLAALKATVQANNNIKIEADSNEMTDF